MPIVTYLSDAQVKKGRSVPDDKECDDLLQDLRRMTGDDWIVRIHKIDRKRSLADRLLGRSPAPEIHYALYADCHGEWQCINCVGPDGGTIFDSTPASREGVMNYMLGFCAGMHYSRRTALAPEGSQ